MTQFESQKRVAQSLARSQEDFPPLPAASPLACSGSPGPTVTASAADAAAVAVGAAAAGTEYARSVLAARVPVMVALPTLLRVLEVTSAPGTVGACAGKPPPWSPTPAPAASLNTGDGEAAEAVPTALWSVDYAIAFAQAALAALLPLLSRLPPKWAGTLALSGKLAGVEAVGLTHPGLMRPWGHDEGVFGAPGRWRLCRGG